MALGGVQIRRLAQSLAGQPNSPPTEKLPRLADAASGMNYKAASKAHATSCLCKAARRRRLMDPTLGVMLLGGKTDHLRGNKEQREAGCFNSRGQPNYVYALLRHRSLFLSLTHHS